MPLCLVRYHCTLIYQADGVRTERADVCTVEEERKPDEWGDPGQIVRRHIRSFGESRNNVLMQGIRSSHVHNWRGRLGDRIGPLEWVDGNG